MIIRELREEDSRDATRILILSFEKILVKLFRDLETTREKLFQYFSNNTSDCYVVEAERIIGFGSITINKKERIKINKFLRKEFGFVNGTKLSMLLKFLCPIPKNKEATINFIAVSPLRRNQGIGSMLIERMLSEAKTRGCLKVKCLVPESNHQGICFLSKFGFFPEKVIENSFVEKYFGERKWYLEVLDLRRE